MIMPLHPLRYSGLLHEPPGLARAPRGERRGFLRRHGVAWRRRRNVRSSTTSRGEAMPIVQGTLIDEGGAYYNVEAGRVPGMTDDTVIQAALDAHNRVFIPAG